MIKSVNERTGYPRKTIQAWAKNKSLKIIRIAEMLGDLTKFLKSNTILDAILFKGKIISVELPIKMDFKVAAAPEGVKGNSAQGKVTKTAEIETGYEVSVPLFVKEGDIIKINTETGEYVERVS